MILPEQEWRAQAGQHREKIAPWARATRARRSRGLKHPVHDFLFTYYSYRPAQLETWHPGLGVALEYQHPDTIAAFSRNPRYNVRDHSVSADPENLAQKERARIEWIAALLRNIAQRPPRFGCLGLHEWAMVYRLQQSEIRHEQSPLRLSPAEIASVVESGSLSCTHYDAFRFFPDSARKLNPFAPSYEQRPDLEQCGCLHTNMDLYKWAYKVSPWICSDLIADAFFLATEARELDMRASPYDLRALGFEPIEIETPAGRACYETAQRRITARAAPLRARLIDAIDTVLAHTTASPLPQPAAPPNRLP